MFELKDSKLCSFLPPHFTLIVNQIVVRNHTNSSPKNGNPDMRVFIFRNSDLGLPHLINCSEYETGGEKCSSENTARLMVSGDWGCPRKGATARRAGRNPDPDSQR